MIRGSYLPLLAGLMWLAARADEPVVFHSDVSLVRVNAQVVDRDNRTIIGLGPRDFLIWDGGKQQKIQGVDAENLPVDLLLLLDVSGSMRPHIERIAEASHEALRQMHDDDRVAVMVFDRATRVRMGFRSGRSDAEREFRRLLDQETFNGGTDITRGLLDAAAYIRREGRPEARRAIVIVTDDQTGGSRDVEGVSRALTRADAVLSALIAPDAMHNRGIGRRNGGGWPGGGGGGWPGGGGGLGWPRTRYPGGGQIGSRQTSAGTREIALESGGDSMPVDDAYAFEDTLARIRQRYAIHFYLPEGVRAGEERDIQVQLAASALNRYPGAELHYRRSYIAPSGNYAPASTGTATSPEPVVVGHPAASDPDPDRPVMRRRPGVSQVPDTSREGPVIRDDPSSPAAPQPETRGNVNPPAPPPPAPDTPGWRKARPDEQP